MLRFDRETRMSGRNSRQIPAVLLQMCGAAGCPKVRPQGNSSQKSSHMALGLSLPPAKRRAYGRITAPVRRSCRPGRAAEEQTVSGKMAFYWFAFDRPTRLSPPQKMMMAFPPRKSHFCFSSYSFLFSFLCQKSPQQSGSQKRCKPQRRNARKLRYAFQAGCSHKNTKSPAPGH